MKKHYNKRILIKIILIKELHYKQSVSPDYLINTRKNHIEKMNI